MSLYRKVFVVLVIALALSVTIALAALPVTHHPTASGNSVTTQASLQFESLTLLGPPDCPTGGGTGCDGG